MPLGAEHLRHWSLPLAIALLAVTLQSIGGQEWLRLEREQAWAEPWRLFGAHFVHLGWNHLGLNLAGLVLLWLLLGDTLRPLGWALGVVVLALGVSIGLLCCSPAVGWYVGFSGVLHGLFAAAAVVSLRRLTPLALAILVVLVVKLLAEQLGAGDPLTADLIGGAVIVDAHLYGVLLGLGYGVFLLLLVLAPRSSAS